MRSGNRLLNNNDKVLDIIRALKGEFGITGLQGKNLGLWDYNLFEMGITEIRSEIRILGFHTKSGNWDYGIAFHLKLGLPDYTPFEIGITGLHPI